MKKVYPIGSKVVIIDGSLMTAEDIKDEKYPANHYHPEDGFPGLRKELFTILDNDGNYPQGVSDHDVLMNFAKQHPNNYKIQSDETNTIWYCSNINIKMTY